MNKQWIFYFFFLIFFLILISDVSLAAENNYEYPELLVTPRASERLEIEAKKEIANQWIRHIPIEISSLATLTAGLLQVSNNNPDKDPSAKTGVAGIAVGGVWLLTSLFLTFSYTPYVSEFIELRSISGKTQRDQLTKERLAEEAFEKASRLATRLQWLSFISNFGVSAFLLSNAKKETLSYTTDIVSLVFSFAPLIFPYRWKQLAKDQEEYKKKIYGPITEFKLIKNKVTQKLAPQIGLTFIF